MVPIRLPRTDERFTWARPEPKSMIRYIGNTQQASTALPSVLCRLNTNSKCSVRNYYATTTPCIGTRKKKLDLVQTPFDFFEATCSSTKPTPTVENERTIRLASSYHSTDSYRQWYSSRNHRKSSAVVNSAVCLHLCHFSSKHTRTWTRLPHHMPAPHVTMWLPYGGMLHYLQNSATYIDRSSKHASTPERWGGKYIQEAHILTALNTVGS